ncbi:MAG: trypsin-like peptidase domain-containing protein [Steroidobacteraceae bacterium]
MRRFLPLIGASVVAGIALAFLAVALWPQLLRPAGSPDPTTVPPAAATVRDMPAPSPAVSSYADAVAVAAPAVVNIYTARVVTERVDPTTLDELLGDFWPRYRQRIERSLGSGVIVDESGLIVTNHHVIADAAAIRVQLADGRIADAGIVGRDPDTDLAVLRVKLPRLPVMHLGRSDQLRVGDVVLAIGNPLGLAQTVTHGIVSATGRGQLGVATFENFIQTDAPINFGNSGGALIDTRGQLIGINTAVIAKNAGVEGIGFAIPVNLVRGVVNEITLHGRVIRGWIGVELRDVPAELAAQLRLPRGGVIVSNLYVGSPAHRAGITRWDLLLGIGGTAVANAQDALVRIANTRPGEQLLLALQRGERRLQVAVTVAEQPATP